MGNPKSTLTAFEATPPITVRRPLTASRSFEERDWICVYRLVLGSAGLGVVVCSHDLNILALSPDASSSLGIIEPGTKVKAGRELPRPVAELVPDARESAFLGEKPKAIPLQTAMGQVFYITFIFPTDLPNAPIVITLRRGELRGTELMAKLRKRYNLTARECQLVDLLRQGRTNRQAAEALHLTEGTVKNYVYFLFQKLGIPTRSALPALLEQLKLDS